MTSSPIVSDAGPLMALAKLNLLHLLKQLYGQVLFTETVYREVVVDGMQRGYPDASTLFQFLLQEAWRPTLLTSVSPLILATALDRGEQESIMLAAERRATLLIDEEEGRRAARSLGLSVRGTLVVLIEAHRGNLLDSDQLRFYFAEIGRRTDIWSSSALCHRLLKETLGED